MKISTLKWLELMVVFCKTTDAPLSGQIILSITIRPDSNEEEFYDLQEDCSRKIILYLLIVTKVL